MKIIYKVSLFDDRQEGKRTEMGLFTNDGMVYTTTDGNLAREKFNEEKAYCFEHCESHNLREPGDEKGLSINICKSVGIDAFGNIRWNWIEQSNASFIF